MHAEHNAKDVGVKDMERDNKAAIKNWLEQGSLASKGYCFEQGAAFGERKPNGEMHKLQGTKGENEKIRREHNGPVGLSRIVEG
eukprot:13383753-Ditylum_brightwellii.AAC.1